MNIDWIQKGAICIDRRGKQYSIITMAKDIQTDEIMIVYSQMFGENEVLCCPRDAFLVSFKPHQNEEISIQEPTRVKPKSAEDRLMDFFDTDDFDEKVKILREMKILGELTNGSIDNIAATLDVVIDEGDLDTRYDQLRICVETRARYETGRLR